MSRQGQATLQISLDLTQAEQQIEAFFRKTQERARLALGDTPGSTGTFGGKVSGSNAAGDPGSWRRIEAAASELGISTRTIQRRIAAGEIESRLTGGRREVFVPEPSRPPAIPAPAARPSDPGAWRAQDPVTQTETAPHGQRRREPRILGAPITQLPPELQQRIRAADPEIDAWYNQPQPGQDAERRRAERERQRGIRQQEQFHQWRVRSEESTTRAQDKEFRSFIRSENQLERHHANLTRASFRADLASMSPGQQLAAVQQRMQGVDPASMEYQQLRTQAGNLGKRTGMNTSIMPGHMYMQIMFAAYDVANTVKAVRNMNTSVAIASSGQDVMKAQLQGIEDATGGILSSVIGAGWDIVGDVLPVNSPAKVKRELQIQMARQQIIGDTQRRTQLGMIGSNITTRTNAGTYGRQFAEAEGRQLASHIDLNKQIQDLRDANAADTLSPVTGVRNMAIGSLILEKKYADERRRSEEESITFDRRMTLETLNIDARQGRLIAAGGTEREIGLEQIRGRGRIAIEKVRREKDPELLKAVTDASRAEEGAFIFTQNRDQQAKFITRRGEAQQGFFSSRGMGLESALSQVNTERQLGTLPGTPMVDRIQTNMNAALRVVDIAADFVKQTSRTNLANNASAQVSKALMRGDISGAAAISNQARMDQELAAIPQGLFRSFTEAGIRTKYASQGALEQKEIGDQLYIERRTRRIQLNEAQMLAKGQDMSASSAALRDRAILESEALKRAGKGDQAETVLQTGAAALKAYERQLKIRLYTEGSAEEVAPGSFGPRGTSTLPKELEGEQVEKALVNVSGDIKNLINAIQALLAQD